MKKGEALSFEVNMYITEGQQTEQILHVNGQKEKGMWRIGDESWIGLREGQSMVRERFSISYILTRHLDELKQW